MFPLRPLKFPILAKLLNFHTWLVLHMSSCECKTSKVLIDMTNKKTFEKQVERGFYSEEIKRSIHRGETGLHGRYDGIEELPAFDIFLGVWTSKGPSKLYRVASYYSQAPALNQKYLVDTLICANQPQSKEEKTQLACLASPI